jgi:hypothetical protein
MLGSDRKHPGGLKLADIRGVEVVKRTEPGAGVVARRHHPLLRILGERGEIVGLRGNIRESGG